MESFDLNASQKTKSTPAGEIPVDWDYCLLDTLAKRGSGHTPDRDNPTYWNGGIKWVSLADSSKLDHRFICTTESEISEEGIRRSSAVLYPENTVILSRDAGVGKSALLTTSMAVSQHFIAWQCGPYLDPLFLYYWLQKEKPYFERIAVGSTIKTIGLGIFRRLGGAFPSVDEQRKIVTILSDWDNSLEWFDALIKTKERRKNAFMQKFLTSASARAGITHARHRIGEVCERVTRKNVELDNNVLTISGRNGLVRQKEYFARGIASADSSGYYLLQRGEFAYNRSTSKGYPLGAIKRLDRYKKGVVSTLYLCFRIKSTDTTSSNYLCHYFESGRLNSALRSIAKEGARAHGLLNVSTEEFFDLDIFLPPLSEQQEIAAILDTCDEEIHLLRSQRAALERQKRGLMQRLLTGKIRVKLDQPTS